MPRPSPALRIVLRSRRNEPGDRLAPPRDRNLLATLHRLEELGEVCLGFEGTDSSHRVIQLVCRLAYPPVPLSAHRWARSHSGPCAAESMCIREGAPPSSFLATPEPQPQPSRPHRPAPAPSPLLAALQADSTIRDDVNKGLRENEAERAGLPIEDRAGAAGVLPAARDPHPWVALMSPWTEPTVGGSGLARS
jgi:hypothetical protein